jgi:aryl-alcohol dehydrogenase-like predicted oxidoreductase
MLHRTRFEKEYEPLYKQFHYGTTIWSPLAGGLLSGKYTKESRDKEGRLAAEGSKSNAKWIKDQFDSGKGPNGLETSSIDKVYEVVEGLDPIAKKLGCSIAQLALAWVKSDMETNNNFFSA